MSTTNVTPKAGCNRASSCLIEHVTASSLASVISLVTTVVLLCVKKFPFSDLPFASAFLLAIFVMAVPYYFHGTTAIEAELSQMFASGSDFPKIAEFWFRVFIGTGFMLAFSFFLATGTTQATRPYFHPIAIVLLLLSQGAFLVWDLIVHKLCKDNAEARAYICCRFLYSDVVCFVGTVLVAFMALHLWVERGLQKQWLFSHVDDGGISMIGGIGVCLYVLGAVFGLTKESPDSDVKIRGGLLDAISDVKRRTSDGIVR